MQHPSTNSSSPSSATPSTIMNDVLLPSNTDRVVRFDNECVLIPCQNHSRRPRMITKSYSLHLWRRPSKSGDAEGEAAEEADKDVVLKVPLPSFVTTPRSPSRGRSTEPITQPLSPCLVHRLPSSCSASSVPPHPRRQPIRRTSLPLPPPSDLVTVPLRPCCTDCQRITEECIKEGDGWQEHFSRGARRLRSSSLEAGSPPRTIENYCPPHSVHTPISHHHHVDTPIGGRFPGVFSLTVDEVDKRRKSMDFSEQEVNRIWDMAATNAGHGQETSSSSTASASGCSERASLCDRLGMGDDIAAVRKGSPILEEDEDQLFPLPSPRRSPNASPGVSPRSSPVPSPNTSSSCLDASPSCVRSSASNSRDSLHTSSDENILGRPYSRKGRCVRGLLTPDASPVIPTDIPTTLRDSPSMHPASPSRLVSSPLISSSTANRAASHAASPKVPLSSQAVSKPAGSPRAKAYPPVAIPARTHSSHSPYGRIVSASSPGGRHSPASSTSRLATSGRASPTSSNSHSPVYHARTYSEPVSSSGAKGISSAPASPPPSPVIPRHPESSSNTPELRKNRSPSPTVSRRRPSLRSLTPGSLFRVGADVLKGVSNIGGGGGGTGVMV